MPSGSEGSNRVSFLAEKRPLRELEDIRLLLHLRDLFDLGGLLRLGKTQTFLPYGMGLLRVSWDFRENCSLWDNLKKPWSRDAIPADETIIRFPWRKNFGFRLISNLLTSPLLRGWDPCAGFRNKPVRGKDPSGNGGKRERSTRQPRDIPKSSHACSIIAMYWWYMSSTPLETIVAIQDQSPLPLWPPNGASWFWLSFLPALVLLPKWVSPPVGRCLFCVAFNATHIKHQGCSAAKRE